MRSRASAEPGIAFTTTFQLERSRLGKASLPRSLPTHAEPDFAGYRPLFLGHFRGNGLCDETNIFAIHTPVCPISLSQATSNIVSTCPNRIRRGLATLKSANDSASRRKYRLPNNPRRTRLLLKWSELQCQQAIGCVWTHELLQRRESGVVRLLSRLSQDESAEDILS